MMTKVLYLFLLTSVDILTDVSAFIKLRQMIGGLRLRQVAFVLC